MIRPVVLLIGLEPPGKVHETTRATLERRFDVRDTEAGSERRPGASTAPLEEALGPTSDGRPPAALAVSVERPGPGLRTLVQEVRQRSPELPILAVTACRERETLAALLESGVDDFSTHPDDGESLLARMWRLAGPSPSGTVPERLREKVALRRLIGRSPGFLELLRRIPLIARADSTVLLTGETGTGKELVSRTIHLLSARRSRAFVPVNCGALPLDLVENELFGHERAAFTGADRARSGLIAEAEGGTLLLDEVDTLPAAAQTKLLRFLQDREYRPLGSPRARRADVRLIAATNADLHRALTEGRLRRDLYYRLNVLPLHLPALRHRPDDVPLLARHFLAEHARALDRPCPALSAGAAETLRRREWPGNVRELSHLMERVLVMSGERGVVRSADVLPEGPRTSGTSTGEPLSFKEVKRRVVERFERQYLHDVLRTHRGNITQAARASKKNRRAFWELLRKHGIDAARFRDR